MSSFSNLFWRVFTKISRCSWVLPSVRTLSALLCHGVLTCLPGSVPFLLREHLSYSQLAIFSLASYPYSLKLFWSPIVDSKFFPSIGRRKSWIIPMQMIIGTIMFIMSFKAEEYVNDVRTLKSLFPNMH